MLLLISLCLISSSPPSLAVRRTTLTSLPRTVAGVLWSILYAHHGAVETLKTVCSFVFLHFFAVGLAISTSLWCATRCSRRFVTAIDVAPC